MIESNFAALENLFLALSDGTRLRLLALMADGEVSVGFLADKLGESQPKISRHLAYLRSAGLVSTRRDGKWIYYNIETQANAGADDVLGITLGAMNGSRSNRGINTRPERPAPPVQQIADTYDDTDMTEWRPAELEVFLL
jgi:ArsR family transcriptional regulator, arsenate/arsenite/antimonite-responsive transcriptional repressor